MYVSKKAAFVRNIAAASINGIITLILLLIAPLGLAAVIFNTLLVTISTFFVGSLCDLIIAWLSVSTPSKRVIRQSGDIIPSWTKSQNIERQRRDDE